MFKFSSILVLSAKYQKQENKRYQSRLNLTLDLIPRIRAKSAALTKTLFFLRLFSFPLYTNNKLYVVIFIGNLSKTRMGLKLHNSIPILFTIDCDA